MYKLIMYEKRKIQIHLSSVRISCWPSIPVILNLEPPKPIFMLKLQFHMLIF